MSSLRVAVYGNRDPVKPSVKDLVRGRGVQRVPNVDILHYIRGHFLNLINGIGIVIKAS